MELNHLTAANSGIRFPFGAFFEFSNSFNAQPLFTLSTKSSIYLMTKLTTLIICLVVLAGWRSSAQSLPSAVPLASREHQAPAPVEHGGFSWQFDVGGKKYESRIAREEIAAGPACSLGEHLPLSLAKAEGLAREQLRKLVRDDSLWEVTELSLRRLGEDADSKWYYVVRLMPKHREPNVIPDFFVVPIGFSGAVGQVQAYGPRR